MTSSTKIKICGLTTPAHAVTAVDAGAEFIGLVFVAASPRCVEVDQARAIAEAVHGRVHIVGLFKDAVPDTVRYVVENVPITMYQLHGAMDEAVVDALPPLPMFRAMAFDPTHIAATVNRWCDYHERTGRVRGLLIDTPDASNVGGGTGKSFDWSALRDVVHAVKPRVPIVLAGGLTPDNVAEAIRMVRPWAVDVSSGVEAKRGVKDPAKIRAFCDAVQAAV